MALKYFLEYPDMVNVIHRLEIYDDNYTDPEIEIFGSVYLDYSSADSPLEAIRGKGLRIELEADQNLTFQDLYSEEQKTFSTVYYRDSVLEFRGWLNPEGWHEDWVTDKWKVSFDCTDGFGYLEDLSFVEDATGLPITGRRSMLNCLSLALIRTGLQQNINADINIFYTGLDTALSVLDNVFINSERYVKDDGETIMSCTEVIRDILEPFAACIISKNGEWFIFKPNQLFLDPELNYFRYDYLGAALVPAKETYATSFTLGSQVNGAYPHHCSANQQKNIKNSIGAYRVNYKYGQLLSILQNPYLCWTGGVPPIGDMEGWTVYPGSDNEISYGACGVTLALKPYSMSNLLLESDDMALASALTLEFNFKGDVNRYPLPEDATFKYRITLTSNDTLTTYALTPVGSWQEGTFINEMTWTENASWIIQIEATETPIAGTMKIEVFTANGTNLSGDGSGGIGGGTMKLNEISIGNVTENSLIEGEFHTVERTNKPSTKVPDVKEVYTGDNYEENYVGALYKADANETTSTWSRLGYTEDYAILQIMGEETLRMSPSPAIVFMGDVYGFFEYLSVVTIQGVKDVQDNDALFMVTEYAYDTKANIISAKFVQIFGGELTDIEYELTYDYGNTTKPTIKG